MNPINPAELHDPGPFGYTHVVDSGAGLVAIAGQYASDPLGRVAVADFPAQVKLAFEHLGTALRAAGLDHRDVIRLGTYVVDHDADRLAVLGTHVNALWKGSPPAQTLLGVSSLAMPGMLFEVDALAVRRAGSATATPGPGQSLPGPRR
ncbi:RidA family protein [Nocardiopsis sp. NPDC058631]|uniref:RidA family protein n=1 Tax=Nocardiopsis sp. NPDC058631 TaxID=3346566 RepID=UPI003665F785